MAIPIALSTFLICQVSIFQQQTEINLRGILIKIKFNCSQKLYRFLSKLYRAHYLCSLRLPYTSLLQKTSEMATEKLIPLESNPDVMDKFLEKLGVSRNWSIVDVMGLDTDALAWVPRPVLSVILLFPTSKAYKEHKQKQEAEILSKGQTIADDVFFMKQLVSNACGTVALVHSVANNRDTIALSDGILKKFLDEAQPLDAASRGKLFKECDGIINAHKELALEGQTNTPSSDEAVDHHFIAFVNKHGVLYELDGIKAFPINHGATTADSLLEDSIKICKEFMARDPNEVKFTVIALTAQDY